VIIDTSAWVEYLRATESPTHHTLRSAVASDAPIATPAPVLMELLAGCSTEEASANLQQLLARFEILEVEGLADFEDAALIQRTCRRKGETIRSMMDCLIAAITLREQRPLLAVDRDFEVISRHVGLSLVNTMSSGSPPSA
jgi:predicted nucleic acid-binding protein